MAQTATKPRTNSRRVTASPVDHVLAALTTTTPKAARSRKAKAAPAPVVPAPKATDRVNSPVLAILESAWVAIRKSHPDLPLVAFTIGGSETARGHFHAETWADTATSGYTRHEVFISGERLKDGPQEILATLLHEAAHALAYVRKVADTSRGGRFHNTRFKALALELGLDVSQVGTIGWSGTTLSEGTAASARYRATLERLGTITGHRRTLTRAAATGRKNNNNGLVMECPTCHRKCRMSASASDIGPMVCWPCYEVDEDLDAATMAADETDES